MPKVVIVDAQDNIVGAEDRAKAVSKGLIVRVVRVFLFNSKGEVLIQKRASNVHLPHLWDQSAGGHVDEGEEYMEAAEREMAEEIGIRGVALKELAKYYTASEYGDTAYKRYNMLYCAISDKPVQINPDEVAETRWLTPQALQTIMQQSPENFTKGFIRAYNVWQETTDKDD
jgi:isopentenyl-diphosphate delta-isomerase